jgi:hypothetical protein
MYIYFDESIISIEKEKYVTVGAVFSNTKIKDNLILKEFLKTKNKLKSKSEIKYSNVRNTKIKTKILNKIKDFSVFNSCKTIKLENNKDIHRAINDLVLSILKDFLEISSHDNFKIIYDKSSYKIKILDIENSLNIKIDFKMGLSDKYAGVQYADWIAGEGSENFKTNYVK